MASGHQVLFPEYEDFLEKLRTLGAFGFVARNRDFPIGAKVGGPPQKRSTKKINQSVLESPRVKNTIIEEALRRHVEPKEVEKEAHDILESMAHKYNLWNIRAFGFFVSSVMDAIYDSIYINNKMLEKVRELSKTNPVVFMPTHKTYFDFLLLSLVCFQYEIELPAIAAGQDFQSMKFVGEVLRRSGAFFMRRNFGNDQLYWAVFSEYVQSQIVNNDRTVEFFVEATRSRVGKSLHPKYGLLQIVLEPYLRGQVFDLIVVPVSMNYDKILEEKLYAYELLGFPKPKESTSGLLKARDVLRTKNGNCFITVGEPISVRDHFGTKLHRSSFVCQPDSQFILNESAKKAIKSFAHEVVKVQNANSIITVWNLVAVAILQVLDDDDLQSLSYLQLHRKVVDLMRLLQRVNVVVNVMKTVDADLRYYLRTHDDLFEQFDVNSDNFHLKLIDFPVGNEEKRSKVPEEIMSRSVSRLILTTYSNGMIHSVFTEALICQLVISDVSRKDSLKAEFRWISTVMKREFVSVADQLDENFEKTLESLVSYGFLNDVDGQVSISDQSSVVQVAKFVKPYLENFNVVFQSISSNEYDDVAEFTRSAQKAIVSNYDKKTPGVRLSFLSTEPIKNAFLALVEGQALRRNERGVFIIHAAKFKELNWRFRQVLGRNQSSNV